MSQGNLPSSPLITNRSPTYLGSALQNLCGRFTATRQLPKLARVIRALRCREFCRSFSIEQFGLRQLSNCFLTATEVWWVRRFLPD
jgi:hypothetical protein